MRQRIVFPPRPRRAVPTMADGGIDYEVIVRRLLEHAEVERVRRVTLERGVHEVLLRIAVALERIAEVSDEG